MSRLAALALAALALALAACGGDDDERAPETSTAAAPAESGDLSGDLVVFAAASLTETFTRLGEAFEAAHPGVTVTFSFGPSSGLAQQIVAGAPADVFAAASPATMAVVADAGAADGEPVVVARNRLQIAVPPGNPGGVTGLADLGKAELTIALCAEEVPCGAAARRAFEAAGVEAAPDTLEQDVKAVLTKVRLGEVDAGLVYRSDVVAAGDAVEGIDVPEAEQAVNDYPIAVLAEARNPAAARAFVDLVRSSEGRAALAEGGFDAG